MRRIVAAALYLILSGCISPTTQEDPLVSPPSHPQALLTSAFPSVLVEVDAVEGYSFSGATNDLIEAQLRSVAGKQEVKWAKEEIRSQGGSYDMEDLLAIAAKFATFGGPYRFSNGYSAWLHLLILNGKPSQPVIGAYLETGTIVVFPDAYETVIGPAVISGIPRSQASQWTEARVVHHELGHAFGLVGCRIPMVMPRQAAGTPCHSDKPESIMYVGNHEVENDRGTWLTWGIEGSRFDEWDLEDIRSFQKMAAGPSSFV